MFISRLAPLALVMVAACHSAPAVRECPLIGTWEWRVAIPDEAVATAHGDDPIRPTELLMATETYSSNGVWSMPIQRPAFGCGWERFTTRADGVIVCSMDDPVQRESDWRLLRGEPRHITVEIEEHAKTGKPARRTYEVIDADHLAFREDNIEYRMVRVKDAK